MGIVGWIAVITFISGVVGTGLGGMIAAVIKRDSSKTVSLLLSFAGGVMISVVCFDLIFGAIFPEDGGRASLTLVIGGIALGYGVVYLLNYIIDRRTNHEVAHIDRAHPATADDLDELIHSDHLAAHRASAGSPRQLFVAGVVMACAIALHNMPEGMVIGASYAGVSDAGLFNGSAITLAIVIGLHNIPEGMAVSVPLISGGMSRGRAVLITALSGAPTIIGALLGYWLGSMSQLGLTLSLSFASGAMLYVVLGELIPEAVLMWRSKMPSFAMLVGIITGMVVIFA